MVGGLMDTVVAPTATSFARIASVAAFEALQHLRRGLMLEHAVRALVVGHRPRPGARRELGQIQKRRREGRAGARVGGCREVRGVAELALAVGHPRPTDLLHEPPLVHHDGLAFAHRARADVTVRVLPE